MKQSEKTMLEFAGYCFIHKPELANELNTLIAGFINNPKEQLRINGVIHCPDELEPVLAKIEHINDLGLSKWYEVVYFDGNWRSYSGSKTFEDGEKVVKWTYCKGCV